MELLQNLHTHTTWCDGKDTPEEMVRLAMEKGFTSLGFSGHSPNAYSPYTHITPETNEGYKAAIRELQQQYRDRFPIYLGLEVEMYSGIDLSGYDYLIGSVHYLKKGDQYLGFDRSPQAVQELIDQHFSGDGMAFAKEYFRQTAELPQYGNFDILGHFDIIAKNLERIRYFDETAPEYLRWAVETLEALRGKIPFFEVNTGAIARGYRSVPYPTLPLLKEFRRLGFGAVISSDCHDGQKLDCAFPESRELLLQAGFTERYILTGSGFEAAAL